MLTLVYDSLVEWPRPEHPLLLACWTIGSYLHPLFSTFPRLSFSGERGSGKSKVLSVLQALAWNALHIITPTPAVLYRLVAEFRTTLLLDELEGLNRDDAGEIRAIINAGYRAGAIVPRCEGKDEKRVIGFPVYAPLVISAIRAPNATTETAASRSPCSAGRAASTSTRRWTPRIPPSRGSARPAINSC